MVPTVATERTRVLVADAGLPVVLSLAAALRRRGYEVIQHDADSIDHLLGAIRTAQPLLVMVGATDHPPGLCPALRAIKEDWRTGNPVTVACVRDRRDAELALVAGADDAVLVEPPCPERAGELLLRTEAILRRAEEMHDASPLTGLPGNAAIYVELQRRLDACAPQPPDDVTAPAPAAALLYADLDHFKAYNDRYGFLQGDIAIRRVASVLREAADGRPGSFVGHIGGDDFVIVTESANIEPFADGIVRAFAEARHDLHDAEDVGRGFIEVADRAGARSRLPLLSLSIGIATTEHRKPVSPAELISIATEMKRYAKSLDGGQVAVDLRRDPSAASADRTERPRVPRARRRLARTGAAIALALVVASLPLSAAQAAQPDSVLWPVRLAAENVRLRLARTPQRRARLHVELAADRAGAITVVLARGGQPDQIASLAADIGRHLYAALTEARSLPEPDRAGLAAPLESQRALLHDLAEARCDRHGHEDTCTALRSAAQRAASAHRVLVDDPGVMVDDPGVMVDDPGAMVDDPVQVSRRDGRAPTTRPVEVEAPVTRSRTPPSPPARPGGTAPPGRAGPWAEADPVRAPRAHPRRHPGQARGAEADDQGPGAGPGNAGPHPGSGGTPPPQSRSAAPTRRASEPGAPSRTPAPPSNRQRGHSDP